jgi:xylulokinase
MSAWWLGLDVGTGGSRALLVDQRGSVHSEFAVPHDPMRMERPLWAEQSPENWAAASREAIRGVLHQSQIDARDVRGIGLSGQMHGLTLLDRDTQVIRPALIWCDQRSQAQVDWIHRQAGAEFVLESIANPMLTGFTLPKLLWVRDHEPANYARIRHVLLPKDYVRFDLTGEFASDVSDASGTGLFDVAHRRWSLDLADRVNVDRTFLPAVYESSAITGRIHAEAAGATGLAEGTPVVAGAGDQAASAVGNGIVEPGLVSCTVGTSGVVFAQLNAPEYDRAGRVHTFCHAVENAWHVMGVTQGAGLSLQWFRNQLAPGAKYEDLIAETAAASAEGLFWLPYLMGERTPHLDSAARGGWIGITAKHTRGDLIRAILEGVAFSLKDCLDVITALGVQADSIRLSGGGARSALWRQIFANVFGLRVITLETQEGSAYGAALLAMAGTGAFGSVAEASKAAVREAESVAPRAAESARYARAHAVYKALYPALRPLYPHDAPL